eukprot:g12046.t1
MRPKFTSCARRCTSRNDGRRQHDDLASSDRGRNYEDNEQCREVEQEKLPSARATSSTGVAGPVALPLVSGSNKHENHNYLHQHEHQQQASIKYDQFVEILQEQKALWSLYDVRDKVRRAKPGTKIFSPPFTLFGIKKMRLVFYPAGAEKSKPGWCAIGLHLPAEVEQVHGLRTSTAGRTRRLRFRLLVGKCAKLTHCFGESVRESWGFVDMCKLEEEVVATVGGGLPMITTTTDVGYAARQAARTFSKKIKEECERNFEDKIVLGVEIIDDIDEHETLEVVSVVGTSTTSSIIAGPLAHKLAQYKKDQCLFSPFFSVSGLDDLRFKFYPNGKKEADSGWCSLYLEAPLHAELRCKFGVGSRKMSFDRLEKFGDESIWGFLSACKISDEVSRTAEERFRVPPEQVEVGVATSVEEAGARVGLEHGARKADREPWLQRAFREEARRSCLQITLEVLETKKLDARLNDTEDLFLKNHCFPDRRKHLLGELGRIGDLSSSSRGGGFRGAEPSRFRILSMELPDSAKQVALQKWDSLQTDPMTGEANKTKKWLDGLLALPFGDYCPPPVTAEFAQLHPSTDIANAAEITGYLEKTQKMLDDAVFGHEEAKEKILQLICQWIANPNSQSLNLGIQGPPGNGKTTLCRRGIAKALNRPFSQISLGGATDAALLEGHNFTYVGSTWGRLAGMLMETHCMNPIIFFDELDKVSDTPRGEEIVGVLTHLTDHSQNTCFTDRYFEGVPLDFSKALFIFSFNDERKLNPVLKDRLTVINTKGFSAKDQLQIAQQYLLPDLLKNVGTSDLHH